MRWIPRCGFLPVAYEVRDDVRTPSCRRMCAHPCYSRIFDTIITIYTRAVNGVYSLFELLAFKQTAAWLIINHHLDNLPLSNAWRLLRQSVCLWVLGCWLAMRSAVAVAVWLASRSVSRPCSCGRCVPWSSHVLVMCYVGDAFLGQFIHVLVIWEMRSLVKTCDMHS